MNRTSMLAICLLSATLLAGCSSPKAKVVKELRQFGIAKPVAKCMGHELDDRLTKHHMKDLARFLDRANDGHDARPGQVLDAIRHMDNPVIVKAATRSGLSCTLLR